MTNCDGWRTMAISPDGVEDFATNHGSGRLSDQDVEFLGSYEAKSKLWCERQYVNKNGKKQKRGRLSGMISLAHLRARVVGVHRTCRHANEAN